MRVRFYNSDSEDIGTVSVNRHGRAVEHGRGRGVSKIVVTDPLNPRRRLTPKDGDLWLKALPYTFRTAYFIAIVEDDDGTPIPMTPANRLSQPTSPPDTSASPATGTTETPPNETIVQKFLRTNPNFRAGDTRRSDCLTGHGSPKPK